MERLAGEVAATGGQGLRALLLGVTPELVVMRWPAGTRLLSVDRCMDMIRGVFPAEALSPTRRVVRGDWLRLPVADGGVDLVVGDGCHTLLESPGGYRAFGREVCRVLRPGGRFVSRLFVRPEESEPVEQVLGDLAGGRIGNFHVFKWRLAMALHDGLDRGVRVGDIWECWHGAGIEPRALAARLGWPEEEIRTIEAYRDAGARYTYPTLGEARQALAPHFEELACHFGDYELGERCPTLSLERR